MEFHHPKKVTSSIAMWKMHHFQKKKSPFSGEIRYLEPENYETIEGFLQALK